MHLSSARLSPLPKGSYTDESLKTLTPLPASLFSGFHLRKALCSYFLRYVRGRQQSQFIVFRLLFLGQLLEERFIFGNVCHKFLGDAKGVGSCDRPRPASVLQFQTSLYALRLRNVLSTTSFHCAGGVPASPPAKEGCLSTRVISERRGTETLVHIGSIALQ